MPRPQRNLQTALLITAILAISALLPLTRLSPEPPVRAQGATGQPPSACGIVISQTEAPATGRCREAAVTVTMQVTQPEALPLHVVFVVARHLLMYDHLDEAKRAAREAVDALDFEQGAKVGLVSLSVQSRTELEMSDRKSDVISAINRIRLDQVRPEARYYDWLSDAEDLLAEARQQARSPREVIVLISTGCPLGFDNFCQRQQASSSRVQGKGITVMGLCKPDASVPPPALPQDHCNAIRSLSSSGSYFELRQSSRAAAALEELDREGRAVQPEQLILTELLPQGLRYVEGSGRPEPRVNAERLRFEWDGLTDGSIVTASYRLAAVQAGSVTLHPEGSVAELIDSLGRQSVPLPLEEREIELLPCTTPTPSREPSPTASPSPASTATPSREPSPRPSPTGPSTREPSPTAQPSAEPASIFLPLAAKRLCKPGRLPADLVLAIDTSSSMSEPMGAATRLDAARQAALRFVELARLDGGGDRLALLAFHRQAEITAMDDDRARIRARLAGLTTAEGTRIDRALALATSTLLAEPRDAARKAVIILLTDGQPEGGSEADSLRAARLAREAGITVYAVAFAGQADSGFLRQLASSPETYLEAPDGAALEAVYERIAEQLPCPGGIQWPAPSTALEPPARARW